MGTKFPFLLLELNPHKVSSMALSWAAVRAFLFTVLVFSSVHLSASHLLKGSVSCLDCRGSHGHNLSGITVAVACKHEKNQATTVTNDKGYFEVEIPSSSPDCFARLIGAPEQLCSYKKFMMSRVVKEKGSDYTLSTPLTFLSSCPSSKAEDMKNEKPKKGSEFGSSKTIDLPLPREWGLAPSSYYLPVLPIIGIP